jgi:hypothetical protein
MEETQSNPIEESQPGRPKLLNILCILTFIGSGMNFVSSLMISVFYDQFMVLAEDISKSFHLPGMELLLEGQSIFFAVSALIYAGSISGAILMWKLKKTGFHVYTIFQILLILSPMYFLHLSSPSLPDLILSGTFIILYGSNLKYMS